MLKINAIWLCCLTVLGCSPALVRAQRPADKFRQTLVSDAALTDVDFENLAKNQPVVKVVPPGADIKKVTTFSIVRLRKLPETSLQAFREGLTQKNNKSLLAEGRFSEPPVITDLEKLALEKGDLDALPNCSVGKCDLNLSAAMIRSMQERAKAGELSEAAASQLFREQLFGYLNDYRTRGNAALIQYENRKTPVKLTEEFRSMIDRIPVVSVAAPEFKQYLLTYPNGRPAGAEDNYNWSKTTFGFDPIISLSHSTGYTSGGADAPLHIVATRQIFASRYASASLALSMLISVRVNEAIEHYLIFTSISHSEELGGLFGELKQVVVESEANEQVGGILQRARAKLEAGPMRALNFTSPPEPTRLERLRSSFSGLVPLAILTVCLLGMIYLGIRWYRSRV